MTKAQDNAKDEARKLEIARAASGCRGPRRSSSFDGFPTWEEERKVREREHVRRAQAAHDYTPPRAAPPAAKSIHADASLTALGLASNATEADVRRAFRLRARSLHPDRAGGDADAFVVLNTNYQRAMKVVRGEQAGSRFAYPGSP